jgi:hypothetical protein
MFLEESETLILHKRISDLITEAEDLLLNELFSAPNHSGMQTHNGTLVHPDDHRSNDERANDSREVETISSQVKELGVLLKKKEADYHEQISHINNDHNGTAKSDRLSELKTKYENEKKTIETKIEIFRNKILAIHKKNYGK